MPGRQKGITKGTSDSAPSKDSGLQPIPAENGLDLNVDPPHFSEVSRNGPGRVPSVTCFRSVSEILWLKGGRGDRRGDGFACAIAGELTP